MVRRHAILGLAAFVAGTGCHAGLSGNTARQEPPIARETVTVKRFVEQHNKNASAVRTLSAQPRIQVSGEEVGSHRVNGMLDLERPRGFRLNLRSTVGGQVADIGSNDQEFWFWVKENGRSRKDAIYVCNHKEVNASPLAFTYQPDWIIEAMGLREINAREAATIAAKPGENGLLVLTQSRKDNKGEMLTKETIVDEKTGHIVEHRLWAGAKKTLLAKATVTNYFAQNLPSTDDNPSGTHIELPEKFRLEWVAEKFTLDITMGQATVNLDYTKDQARRSALFSEPAIRGADRVDLARLQDQPTSTSKTYESMPSPRSGVRLGSPEAMPMDVEGAIRTRGEPQPLSADLSSTPAQPAGVVGAAIPRAVDPEAVRASASRRSWRPSLLDR